MSKDFPHPMKPAQIASASISRFGVKMTRCVLVLLLGSPMAEAIGLSPASSVFLSPAISTPASARFETDFVFPEELRGFSLCLPNCSTAGAEIVASPGNGGGPNYGANWSLRHTCVVDDSQMNGDCTVTVSYTPLAGADSLAELRLEGFDESGSVPGSFFASLTGRVTQSFSVISLGGSEYRGREGGTVSIPVSRRGAAADLLEAVALTFDVFPEGGATLGDDYAFPNGARLDWISGEAGTKNLLINLAEDAISPEPESFTLAINSASLGQERIGQFSSADVSIIDVPVVLDTVALTTATLGIEEDDGSVEIFVRRTGNEGGGASVNYRITRGTASLTQDISPQSLTGQVIWEQGETGDQSISIPLVVDDVVEADETFIVTLSGADGVTLGTPDAVTVTIINDDEEPTVFDTVALTTATLAVEEDEGSVNIVVRRSGGEGSSASVNYRITRGTASLSEDISPESLTGQVNWDGGETPRTRTIRIPLVDDDEVEADETFIVTLSGADGVTLGTPDVVTVTIIDNDDEPTVLDTVALTSATLAIEEGEGSASISVRRTGNGGSAASVSYSITRGTASLTEDISPASLTGQVSWDVGETTRNRTILIPVVDDDEVEADETFVVTLSGADGVTLGTPAAVTVTIIDDDVLSLPGTIQFTRSNASVNEDDGSLTVSVTRTGGRDGAVSVDVSTRAGSASAGNDFVSLSTTLSWASGDTSSRTVAIPIEFDTDVELAETFTVVLSNAEPGNEVIGSPAQLTVTINDVVNGQFGMLQFADGTVAVDEDSGTISLSVLRRGGADGEVSVGYATVAGTASAGTDFVTSTGVLRWVAGDSAAKTLRIPIVNDTASEPNESFSVVLSNAEPLGDNQQLGSPSRATVTIRNVDPPVVEPVQLDAGTLQFANTSFLVDESDGVVVLSVQRIGGSEGAVSIQYETASGTAVAGADFSQASGSLNWADGDSDSKSFSISILGDVELETQEAFEVMLINPVSPANATLEVGADVAAITINDSTNVGQVGFTAATVSEAESRGQVILDIERFGGDDGPVTVNYVVIGESATAGEDFTATSGVVAWGDGESGSRSIAVLIRSDDLIEETETFIVRLSNATPLGNAQIALAQVQVQIGDSSIPGGTAADDLAYRLSIVSGNGQSGLPGDTLDPLVIEATPTSNSNTQEEGISIVWRVLPAGSAELLNGGQTATDADGLTSNQVRILSRGFVRVIAVPDSSAVPDANSSPSSAANPLITTRIDPPQVDLAQGEVAFTIRAGLFAANGLNDNQAETGRALDTACEALSSQFDASQPLTAAELDLRATCLSLDSRLQDGSLAGALDRLAPEELFFFADSVIDTADLQITNVYSRINAIRSRRRSDGNNNALDLSGLNLNLYGQLVPGSVLDATQNAMSGGGAAADTQLQSRLGVFANGTVSVGTVDGDDHQRNADVQSSGVTIGVDYRLNENAVLGAGLGIASSSTDFTADEGTADLSAFSVTLFGTWYEADAGYFDAVLDVGQNSYDVKRRINFIGAPDQFAIGSTDASVLSFTIGVGNNIQSGAWEFGPYGRMSLTTANVDGYSESASSDAAGFGSVLNISSHAVKSTTIAVGGQLSRTINTRRGVFLPQLRVEAEFENEDRKEGIEAVFQHDPSQTAFTVNGNPRDTRYINVGLGASAVFSNGKSAYLFYETRALHDFVTQHWLKLGLRLEF